MLKSLIHQIKLTWRLLRDPRVPVWAKAIPFLPLVYVLSPLDFLPDVIPVIGQLDDLTIMILGMRMFEVVVPDYIRQEHRDAIARGERPVEVIESHDYRLNGSKQKRG
jgi:uncharacterized membrane protein YkvA (DUF1232 family)